MARKTTFPYRPTIWTGWKPSSRSMANKERIAKGLEPGTFSPWEDLPAGTDLLFYEGLHAGVMAEGIDLRRHVDLLIGVVPIVNLEWIQKIHRDTHVRGYSQEAVVHTILGRME